MPIPSFVLLLVDDPARSAGFYADLLETAPIESSPTFALFALTSGLKLGLWSRHTVEPPAVAAPGAAELGFVVDDVDAVHVGWCAKGFTIVQAPTDMDFGRSCMVLDPDGHRLRAFTPA